MVTCFNNIFNNKSNNIQNTLVIVIPRSYINDIIDDINKKFKNRIKAICINNRYLHLNSNIMSKADIIRNIISYWYKDCNIKGMELINLPDSICLYQNFIVYIYRNNICIYSKNKLKDIDLMLNNNQNIIKKNNTIKRKSTNCCVNLDSISNTKYYHISEYYIDDDDDDNSWHKFKSETFKLLYYIDKD